MIRIAIIILVLLIGCAMPPEPEPQFIGQYLSLHGDPFKTDCYPNLKELGRSYHSNYVKYLTPDGKIVMARYDDKKGALEYHHQTTTPQRSGILHEQRRMDN